MSLRWKLTLPLAAAAALILFGLLAEVPAASWSALALLGLLAFNTEAGLQRPLGSLRRLADQLGDQEAAAPATPARRDDVATLHATLESLQQRMREMTDRLAYEANAREEIGRQLRDLQERYLLTVERANDGIWECDLKTGALTASPRWNGMLGYAEGQVARLDQWKQLLHRDDRDAILIRFNNHVEGITPCFDAEYRLRQCDGSFRWLHSRGTALRHASGKPYRIVVLDNDVHPRKQLEETLVQAAEGLANVSGEDFFRALTMSLSQILGTRDNLIAYCLDDPPTRVRTLAYYSNGEFWDNFEFELSATSCGDVILRREVVYVPTGVCDIWPLEKAYDRDSYLGVPMFDSNGKVIGHFACMDGKPMRQDLPHLALFRLFSVRAAAEVERTLLKQRLEREASG